MPKCVRCFDVFPPVLMVPVTTAVEDVSQCIFCEREIKEVTMDKEDGTSEKYTKEQAKRDYVKFLNELKDKQKIADILAKKGVSPILRP